ncbi:MAG TPA: hypothetical protein VK481_04590 [Gemmatimonadaceae bacterium]|nr:hypothetical protein [Gemmatimonadaceae bacterium]
MFLAHYGVAFAAKRAAPRTSLGALTFAAQFLDELWPILLLLDIEQVRIVPGIMVMNPLDFTYYPYSHSLVMAIVWGIVIGGVYFLLKRYHSGGWTLGLLVVSHWFLDVPVHGMDLPIWPGASSPKVGWGLWNYVPLTYLVEFTIYVAGAFIYARSTRPRNAVGKWGFWAYALILPIIYVMSNGPPPSSERALAWTALLLWLFVPWAWWVDKHRDYVGRIRVPIEEWAES